MKERPILFSAPMVMAILEGKKTQTRRIWKLPKWADWDEMEGGEKKGCLIPSDPKLRGWLYVDEVACPYGRPGDRLWVREAWRIGAWDCNTGVIAIDYRADESARREWLNIGYGDGGEEFYRYIDQSIQDCVAAGMECDSDGGYRWEPGQSPCRWCPSIHMPRWASRIMLEITVVRVERLGDIGQGDACAEGCPSGFEPIGWYRELWEQINGPGSWALNPWVWVIEFRRLK
ncbi:MAG: ASCH domain-containing protein [Acidobacteriaceae bacterium]